MNRADHASVLDSMLLADGRFWPLPVTLPVSPETARDLSSGDHLALRDQEGFMLAVLRVEEVFAPDLAIDTTDIAPEEAARTVLDHLREQGYLSRP
jgi:sulfate adenylyltransferase